MRALVLILMFSFPLLCNAGEIYKWRDKDGNIHYSDVEPAKQTAQRKVVKPKSTKALSPEEQAAKDKADKAAEKASACSVAQSRVKIITSTNNIQMDLNNDGKPESLTPEQYAQQTEILKAQANIQCAN